MRHPSMSTRGTHIAFGIAVAIAFFLPKRVDCGYPGASCNRAGTWQRICTDYQIEPVGFYALELLVKRDIGFAYSSDSECR